MSKFIIMKSLIVVFAVALLVVPASAHTTPVYENTQIWMCDGDGWIAFGLDRGLFEVFGYDLGVIEISIAADHINDLPVAQEPSYWLECEPQGGLPAALLNKGYSISVLQQ